MLVGLLGMGGFQLWRRFRPAPPVVLPAQPDQLEPNVARLIQQHADRVRSAPRSAEAHATLGLVYEANKMWAEAHASFANVLRLDPDNHLAAYHLTNARYTLGDVDGALQAWRELARRYPNFAPLHCRLGEALLETGDHAEAAEEFQRAIDLAPNSAEPYVGLADAKIKLGDLAGAATAAGRAVRLSPTLRMAHYVLGMAYRGLKRFDAAERELALGTPAVRQHMTDEWTDRAGEYVANLADQMGLAMDMIDAGRAELGIRILERALASRPNDVQVMSNLATAYMEIGQLEKCRDLLLRAERVDNQAFATYINLAGCHISLKRFPEALKYADRAVELAPNLGRTHLVRGRALMRLERLEEALAAFKTSASLDARFADAYLEIGDVFVRMQRYSDARQNYETALKLVPGHVPLRISLCGLYMKLNELDRAEAMLKVAQELAPNHPRVSELAAQLAQLQRR